MRVCYRYKIQSTQLQSLLNESLRLFLLKHLIRIWNKLLKYSPNHKNLSLMNQLKHVKLSFNQDGGRF